jgi:hypothetical protein
MNKILEEEIAKLQKLLSQEKAEQARKTDYSAQNVVLKERESIVKCESKFKYTEELQTRISFSDAESDLS